MELQIVLRSGPMTSVLWTNDWPGLQALVDAGNLALTFEGPRPYRSAAYYAVCAQCRRPAFDHNRRHRFIPHGFQECEQHGWFYGFPEGCPECSKDADQN